VAKKFTKSWINPTLEWDQSQGKVVLDLPLDATGVVELLAKGNLPIPKCWESVREVIFLSEFKNRVWQSLQGCFAALNPPADWCRAENRLRIHLHSIYHWVDTDRLLLVLSLDAVPNAPGPSLPLLQKDAEAVWNTYLERVEDKKSQEDVGRACFGDGEPEVPEPVLAALLDLQPPSVELPVAIWVPSPPKRPANLAAIREAIQTSRLRASRDGHYAAISATNNAGDQGAVIVWQPASDLPSFPELRAAAARTLPSAFQKPRNTHLEPPQIDVPVANESITPADLSDITNDINKDDVPALADWTFVPTPERAARGRDHMKRGGIEALGWYQPFHSWSDETWGIYLHTDRIHDFASALHEDLKRQRSGHPQALAAFLAVALVYYHECFHAKLEAAATLLEVQARGGRFRRYARQVYSACAGQPCWLEEALANWWTLDALKHRLTNWEEQGLVRSRAAVQRVLEGFLDFSPPGYSDWRQGDDPSTWRVLASEMVSGRPGGAVHGLPLPAENLLSGTPGFDWLPEDVPTRFVGDGVFADRFFSAPKRREVVQALRHFGFTCDTKRGKGSHERWFRDDGKTFTLPHRDPLSVTVFHTLLTLLDVSKQDYLNKIRPEL
jgi:hypothetical protein